MFKITEIWWLIAVADGKFMNAVTSTANFYDLLETVSRHREFFNVKPNKIRNANGFLYFTLSKNHWNLMH